MKISVYAIVPVVFFSCLSCAYRGDYFEYQVDEIHSKALGINVSFPGFYNKQSAKIVLTRGKEVYAVSLPLSEWVKGAVPMGNTVCTIIERTTPRQSSFAHFTVLQLPDVNQPLSAVIVKKIPFEPKKLLWKQKNNVEREKILRNGHFIFIIAYSSPSFNELELETVWEPKDKKGRKVLKGIYDLDSRTLKILKEIPPPPPGTVPVHKLPGNMTIKPFEMKGVWRKVRIEEHAPEKN